MLVDGVPAQGPQNGRALHAKQCALAVERHRPDDRDFVIGGQSAQAPDDAAGDVGQTFIEALFHQRRSGRWAQAGLLASHEATPVGGLRRLENERQEDAENFQVALGQCLVIGVGIVQRLFGSRNHVRQLHPDLREDVLDARQVNPFLVVEIVLQRRRIDPGSGCDLTCRGAFETMGGELVHGGFDNPQARFFPALVAAFICWSMSCHG